MKKQKTKYIARDYQTLSLFLILGVLTIGFVIGMRWFFLAPGAGPAAMDVTPVQEMGASR